MYQKDYILRLIEACSTALARIIGLKERGKNKQALEEIKKVYDELLKVDLNQILDLQLENIKDIEIEKLEMIADLMRLEGELEFIENRLEKSKKLYHKALEIFKHIDNTNKTFSYELKNKISKLENLLN